MASSRPDVGKAGTTLVNFVCQRCSQPLRLDQSFSHLDHQLLGELTAPLTSTADTNEITDLDSAPLEQESENVPTEELTPLLSKKVIPPARLVTSESGNGFTLLGESEAGSAENISRRLKVTCFLFDVLSGQSEIDHPLCEECTDNLLDQLDQQLKMTEDECKDYRDFLLQLDSTQDTTDEQALDDELKQLRGEEEMLKQQLHSIESERKQLKEQTELAKEESKKLDQEEERYWKEYNDYKRQLLEFEDAQRSNDNQLKYAQAQLDRLKKTNVFNATFHIWHSGHFGTINNFRLGRLPSVPVDWNEINAAWGQTVLLLHSLAKKMDLTFKRYRLVPYGNHSYIESLTDKKELPLYGTGGFKFFWDTKFDQAMVAFLDCLQQFKEAVEKGDTGFSLPYKMEKGKIEDTSTGTSYSIKIQFNSEEQWTKALKFMLTNLKWGLAWVSSQFANK